MIFRKRHTNEQINLKTFKTKQTQEREAQAFKLSKHNHLLVF